MSRGRGGRRGGREDEAHDRSPRERAPRDHDRVLHDQATRDHGSREAVVATLRPHARRMFWPSVALLLLAAATSWVVGQTTLEPWVRIGASVAGAVLSLLLFLMPLVAWLARTATITTRRVVLRSGVLVRTRQEVLHRRGYDVTVRRSGLQLVFRSGDVVLDAGFDRPLRILDVADPELVQSALLDLAARGGSTGPALGPARRPTGEAPRARRR